MTRALGLLPILLAVALLAAQAGCGKRPSELKHPEGAEATYPRTYPAPR